MSSIAERVPIKSQLTNTLEASIEIGIRSVADLLRPYDIIVPALLSRAQEETGDFGLNNNGGNLQTPYLLAKLISITPNPAQTTNSRTARHGSAMKTIKENEVVKLKTMPAIIELSCTFYSDSLSTLLDFTSICMLSNSITSIVETEEAKIYSKVILPQNFSYVEKSFSNGADTIQRLESMNFEIQIETHAAITTRETIIRSVVANIYGPSNENPPGYEVLDTIVIGPTPVTPGSGIGEFAMGVDPLGIGAETI